VRALEAGARRESLINAGDEDVWWRSFRNPNDVRRLSRIRKRGQVAEDDEVGVRCRSAQGVEEIGGPSDFVAHELQHARVDLPGLRVISDEEHPGRWTRWTADSHRGAIILSLPAPPSRSFGPLCVSVQPGRGCFAPPAKGQGGGLRERVFANAISGLSRKRIRNKIRKTSRVRSRGSFRPPGGTRPTTAALPHRRVFASPSPR
jgi:hypothetical protein